MVGAARRRTTNRLSRWTGINLLRRSNHIIAGLRGHVVRLRSRERNPTFPKATRVRREVARLRLCVCVGLDGDQSAMRINIRVRDEVRIVEMLVQPK